MFGSTKSERHGSRYLSRVSRELRGAILFGSYVSLAVFWSFQLWAHDGLHIDIEKLTAQIDALATPRADLFLVRSRLLRAHGKPTEALADCDRALSLLGDDTTSLLAKAEQPLERALVLIALERAAEAEPLLDEVIEIAGDRYVDSLDARAQLRHDDGRTALALADATRAFRASPTLDRALRRGTWLTERGMLSDAAASYREAIERLGASRLIRDAWITVEIERGEYESALSMIDAELERAVVRTVWLLRRAQVYEAAGNEKRKNEELRAALIEADRVLARRRLPVHLVLRGEVHLAIGDFESATRDAEEARAIVPEFLKIHELLTSIEEARAKLKESKSTPPRKPATPVGGKEQA